MKMKIVAASLMVGLLAAGCTTTEKRAAGGAVVGGGAGAVIGGIAGGGKGAVIGAAVGAATGAVIGAATTPGYCVSRRKDGSTYEARCPSPLPTDQENRMAAVPSNGPLPFSFAPVPYAGSE